MLKRTSACFLIAALFGLVGISLRAQVAGENRSFPVQPGDTLSIGNDFGTIRLRPWDRATVEITIQKRGSDPAHKNSPDVSSRKSGNTIFLQSVFSGAAGESIDIEIKAPALLNLTISGASPAIDIAGFQGVVRVQSSAGRIMAEDLASTASLVTESGDIFYRTGTQPQGDVRLESTSGNISCDLVDQLNLRSMIRAGGRISWDMDPALEGASLEKQLGTAGPLLYAGSLKGNVVVRLRPALASRPPGFPGPVEPAREAQDKKPDFVRETPQTQPPKISATSGVPPKPDSPSEPAVKPPILRREPANKVPSRADMPAKAPDPARSDARVPPPADRQRETVSPESRPPVTVQGEYALKIAVDSVYLNVSVRDRNTNRSIGGLKREDFLVFEDRAQQEVAELVPAEAPFNLLLLLDVSGSTQSFLRLMKQAAIDFTRQIKANDRIAIATFNSNVQLVENFTNNRATAEKAINSIRSGGGTAFYDALMTCLDRYMRGIEGRSAIVVFTDGVDNQLIGMGGAGSRTTFDELYRRVQEGDTIIYTIFLNTEDQVPSMTRSRSRFPGGVGGYPGQYPGGRRRGGFPGGIPFPMPAPQPSPNPVPRRQQDVGAIFAEAKEQLQEIADETGGRMYTPRKIGELSGVYSEIADDLRIQYLLAYNSTNTKRDGGWREIRVEVENRPEAVARTRRGYYARGR